MGKMKIYLLLPMIAVLAFGSVSFAQNIDREALKAELRAELKAELKKELMADLKSETKAEVQEATLGLRDVLQADFRDDIRSEIMQEAERTEGTDYSSILGGMFKGTTVTGFVDVSYVYNFRNHGEGRGDTDSLGNPVINRDANDHLNFVGENEDNSFTLENFAMFIDKECTDEHPIGWQMHTYWGEKAQRITFAGPANDTAGSTNADGPEGQHDRFAIAAANISWNAPILGKHVKFTIGKMYTWIGYELVENIGNPNYTHAQTYNNAIPFTHTGMSADVSEFLPSDKWGLVLYGVNGWDSYIDNNETKTFGTYLTYQPNDDFFISLATIYGGEGWGRGGATADGDKTMMYNVVATYSLPQVDKLSLGFDWNHGYSQHSGNTLNSGAHWWAAVAYVMYDYTDNQQGAFRYEYFDDDDGTKGFGKSLWTVTYTHNITIHDNLMLRPEIRYNKYNGGTDGEVPSGGNVNNTEDDEVVFAFGTEYVF
ncbi:MAG: outer membrane beta-barrel protein [Planctomycetota bacterium]|jgi:hypothetical protein